MASVIDEWMCVEHSWNDAVRGKQKYSENNLYQWHFSNHKYHMDWHAIKNVPARCETNQQPPQPWHSHRVVLYSGKYGYKVCTYIPQGVLCVPVALVRRTECASFTARHHNVVLAALIACSSLWLNVWTVVLWYVKLHNEVALWYVDTFFKHFRCHHDICLAFEKPGKVAPLWPINRNVNITWIC